MVRCSKIGGFMSRKELLRRILIMVFVAALIFTFYSGYIILQKEIPDTINLRSNMESRISINIPLSATFSADSEEVSLTDGTHSVKDNITLSKKDMLYVNADESGEYDINVKLLGILDIKKIKVNVFDDYRVIPCGMPVGMYLKTDGVMVIGTGNVEDAAGEESCPAKDVIFSDDYIVAINDINVSSKSQLIYLINKYGENDIKLGIRRDGKKINVKIKPVRCSEKDYKIGVWVRDDTQGIGTLTYVDEDGNFGALGHGISDIDTGKLLSSEEGKLYTADIWGIKKGEKGAPGGLCGTINYDDSNLIGNITSNNDAGIYGVANERLINRCGNEPVEICLKQEVKEGKATVLCTLENEVKEYDIVIEKVDHSNNNKYKGMVIQVTDPELLGETNGIVQGLSGSPILQNNKIVGAVTHVFVNDPTKGYGILIEEMITVQSGAET